MWATDLNIPTNGTSDIVPAFEAAQLDAAISTIQFPPGAFKFGSRMQVRSGLRIMGAPGGLTRFEPLATFAPREHLYNRMLTTMPESRDIVFSDLTLDGLAVGLGQGSNMRLCGLAPTRTQGCLVERCTTRNWSGYGLWFSGDIPDNSEVGDQRLCSGEAVDCLSQNCDVNVEVSLCDGVILRRVNVDDGDGTIHCEAGILIWHGSRRVKVIGGSYTGTADAGLQILSAYEKAISSIQVGGFKGHMLNHAPAFSSREQNPVDAAHRITGLVVEDSDFYTRIGNCTVLKHTDAAFERTNIQGLNVGLSLAADANLTLEDCEVLADNSATGTSNAWGLYQETGTHVTAIRGALRARGQNPRAYRTGVAGATTSLSGTVLEPMA